MVQGHHLFLAERPPSYLVEGLSSIFSIFTNAGHGTESTTVGYGYGYGSAVSTAGNLCLCIWLFC